ncbi:MAG TPA: tetratricopeptide repeat protein, partial [Acidobacteriota bacterium]|nr:tetratricopeptide repeat protein [Acidobacteriota bacterium]
MLEKYKILRSAERHVINRNLNQAIREYERIAEQESEDPGILNTLGDLLLKDGRRDEALAHFRRVAEIYSQSGFLSKAIATCKKIHHLDPRDDETNSRLIELFSKQGLTSEAVHHLENLVQQCQTWGQLDSALVYQEQILNLVANRPDHYLSAARLLHQLDRVEEAEHYYLKAARLFRNQGSLNLG